MLQRLKRAIRHSRPRSSVSIQFDKTGDGWLVQNLAPRLDLPNPPEASVIEARARATNQEGPVPLWDGYRHVENYPRDTNGVRTSEEVRSTAIMGRFYSWVVTARRPSVIVEFGTAFGVSGMYWLAGLNAAGNGTLFTFEPNQAWATLARENLKAISDRYRLTVGTFEDNAAAVLDGIAVDIAFIDAIHTSEFVFSQFAILKQYLRPGALVLFDDIDFSSDMRLCWSSIATAPEVAASARIDKRVGIVERAARRD